MYINNKHIGYIYKITCKLNSKIYVGQTIQTIDKRIIEHLSDTKLKSDNSPLHRAIRKYGWENFVVEMIELIECEELSELRIKLNKAEIYYISFYNSHISKGGYNISSGGQLNDYLSKKIDVYSFDKQFIKTFNNKFEVAEEYNISPKSVINCCNGQTMIVPNCNFIFRYHNDDIDKYDYMSTYERNKTYKYSLQGKLLGEYLTTADAARSLTKEETKNPKANISLSGGLKKHNGKCVMYGYFWTKEKYFDKEFIDNLHRNIRVSQYDINGNLLNEFNSISEAALFVSNNGKRPITAIINSCKGINKHLVYNSVWRYAQDSFDKYSIA